MDIEQWTSFIPSVFLFHIVYNHSHINRMFTFLHYISTFNFHRTCTHNIYIFTFHLLHIWFLLSLFTFSPFYFSIAFPHNELGCSWECRIQNPLQKDESQYWKGCSTDNSSEKSSMAKLCKKIEDILWQTRTNVEMKYLLVLAGYLL